MAAIQLENITHAYGKKMVLENFSLSISGRETTCLLGGTGTGKTTIIRLIAGLEKPKSGRIYINEQKVTEDNKTLVSPEDRNIGLIFQDLALWPHLTVFKNIEWGLKIKKVPGRKEKVEQMLEMLSLQAHRNKYPNQLSGGQKQLAAIARSLVLDPSILLMDEPLSSLDTRIKVKTIALLKQIKSMFNTTIIFVTHDHREALELADEITVLNDDGIIEQTGTKEEILQSENPFVKSFISL